MPGAWLVGFCWLTSPPLLLPFPPSSCVDGGCCCCCGAGVLRGCITGIFEALWAPELAGSLEIVFLLSPPPPPRPTNPMTCPTATPFSTLLPPFAAAPSNAARITR
ncbi:hypothetical protein TRVL_04817 [Trypanosoma vivax]|nr:hypothetical protein TRVL_04817 [Trypanosoma vivax]